MLSGGVPTDVAMVSASEDPVSGGALTVQVGEVAAVRAAEPESSSDTDDDDNLFLTQHDPQDMDLCSQLENSKAIIVAHKDTVQREDSLSRPQLESLSIIKCKYKDCVETTKKPG